MKRILALAAAALCGVAIQAKADERLTVLDPRLCGAGSQLNCAAPAFQKVWRTVRAANGSAIKIDVASIERFRDGTRHALIYGPYVPGTALDQSLAQEVSFDCAGHYFTAGGFIDIAPPHSLIGAVAKIACSH